MEMISFKRFFIKIIIIGFWVSIIISFLFSPKIIHFFITEKSLSIFTFPNIIDANYITAFEKKTGIKLHVSYYENNDELLVKLRETKGRGYDIIMPSDYAVELLIKDGLLKKIDKSKLDFFHMIDSKFLGHYFDPHNDYSIPYLWEVYTIGMIKSFFKKEKREASWKLVFDENKVPCCIGMVNNAREAVLLAAFYLFGTIDNLTQEQLKKVKKLLIRQKKWVESYTDLRSDYLLLSGTCPVSVGMSGEIWQAARFNKNIAALIPNEGTFFVIDSFAISAKSKKMDMIYKFANYLYSSDVMAYHVDRYSLFPAKNVKLPHLFINYIEMVWKKIKEIHFFRNVLSEQQLNDIWIQLKAG